MGPRVSVARSTILNEVTSVLETTIDQSFQGGSSIRCSNIQSIIGSVIDNCDINFAEQSCNATVISDVTTSQSFQNIAKQEIFNEIEAVAEATNKGLSLQLADVSSASAYVENVVTSSNEVVFAMRTDCTKNVTNVNLQTLEDSVCFSSTVNFAAQDVSSEIIASCSSESVGNNQSFQDITNIVSASATATIDGLSFLDALMPLIIFLVLIIIIVVAVKVVSTIAGQSGGNFIGLFIALTFLLIFMFAWILFVWPGASTMSVAAYIGAWPWPFPISLQNGDNYCKTEGSNYPRDQIINYFIWYDESNVSQSVDYGSARYYKSAECGLFSGTGCDDPDFLTDQDLYNNAFEACRRSSPNFGSIAPFSTCSVGQLSANFFTQSGYGLGETSYNDFTAAPNTWMDDYCSRNSSDWRCVLPSNDAERRNLFDGSFCRRCEPGDGENLTGIYVRTGESCDTNNLDTSRYFLIGKDAWTEQTFDCADAAVGYGPAGVLFPDEGTFCYSNPFSYMDDGNANDCLDAAYQRQKSQLARVFRACTVGTDVYRTAQPNIGDRTPYMSEICPVNPIAYFTKCGARSTGEIDCTYVSASGTQELECTNDFSSCQDPDYVKDLNLYNAVNAQCQSQGAKARNGEKYGTGVGVAVLLLIIVVVFITVFVAIPRQTGKSLKELATTKPTDPTLRDNTDLSKTSDSTGGSTPEPAPNAPGAKLLNSPYFIAGGVVALVAGAAMLVTVFAFDITDENNLNTSLTAGGVVVAIAGLIICILYGLARAKRKKSQDPLVKKEEEKTAAASPI